MFGNSITSLPARSSAAAVTDPLVRRERREKEERRQRFSSHANFHPAPGGRHRLDAVAPLDRGSGRIQHPSFPLETPLIKDGGF